LLGGDRNWTVLKGQKQVISGPETASTKPNRAESIFYVSIKRRVFQVTPDRPKGVKKGHLGPFGALFGSDLGVGFGPHVRIYQGLGVQKEVQKEVQKGSKRGHLGPPGPPGGLGGLGVEGSFWTKK
jgi:hypothetical protein